MTTMETTAGASGGSTRSSSKRAQWSDLPDDIFGNIRLKIASLCDRVHLAAVCRPWRATAARLPAPPSAPLLLVSSSPCINTSGVKNLYGADLTDSWVLRIPDKVADNYIIGSHEGGWIVAFDYGTRKLMVVNVFSGAEVPVCSPWQTDPCVDLWWNTISHVIFSDDPTSSNGCILATISNDKNYTGLCKVGSRSGWTKHGCEKKMSRDIAFCNGDLYAIVDPDEQLVRFTIGIEKDGSPIVTSTHKIAIQKRHGPESYYRYIVELRGKPIMAMMTRWLPNREPFFKVFELVDVDTSEAYQHKWTEMTGFGDYALFLGPGKSKAVHVPVGAERRGFERNYIYYTKATRSKEMDIQSEVVYTVILDNGRRMSCRKHQSIGDGLQRIGYYFIGWQNASMWLHPPDM